MGSPDSDGACSVKGRRMDLATDAKRKQQVADEAWDALARAFPDQCHETHVLRASDASTYDVICIHCRRTDEVPGGWGKLRFPCLRPGGKAPGLK